MAEKGGKGFSLPGKAAAKTTLKATSAKDGTDSSGKSKRGRKKVQFNTSDSPEPLFSFSGKSDGKFSTLNGKGDSGKGGKGEKVANGGKIPEAKDPQSLELRIEQELPKEAKCMMDCEAANALLAIQEQMVVLSRDPDVKIPVSFDRGLQYARRSTQYTNTHSVRRVLETLKPYGVSDGELCVIAYLCPETLDEVFSLPSLKSKWSDLREPVKKVLGELAKLKKST
ncbi:RNA_pol_Rpb4 domain-containing protein [Cephalotus follicularis]|uniref:RNA_pol_Rpb4 domain-containing protein n=1 Tax=Cephalotus follicularis TaxID=3775 RepID=A0A1Q3BRS6_CEPFO|nr:RNA_pol_Rpb4 domain-containing protein [Cephalotus follicularis]